MSIPLEDLFTDVIAKAQRGMGLDDEGLAAKATVSVNSLISVKGGAYDDNVVNKISLVLNLHAPSLQVMAKQGWLPDAVSIDGLAQFNTTYEDMTVNAYVVWDPATKGAAAFDTGASAKPMVEFIEAKGLKLEAIFLTHTHPDHVADIPTLRTAGQPVYVCAKEPWEGAEEFDAGREFTLGGLRIETKQTWGHSKGGITYVVRGLKNPVAIVGDAVFASSMGGGAVSYTDALATNRRYILSLPEATIICPGHGPLTTVTEEKAHNPFFPEYK
jgi:hydroxyacylglutathione hydrolase